MMVLLAFQGIGVLSGNRQDDEQDGVSITVEDEGIITGKKTILHPKSSRVAQIGAWASLVRYAQSYFCYSNILP
jgi:hypothetical protein